MIAFSRFLDLRLLIATLVSLSFSVFPCSGTLHVFWSLYIHFCTVFLFTASDYPFSIFKQETGVPTGSN